MLRWSLRTQIIVALLLAAILPLIPRLLADIAVTQDNTLDNVRSFAVESGERRRLGMTDDFETVLSTISSFIRDTDNNIALVQALSIRDAIGTSNISRQLASKAEELLNTELVNLEAQQINSALIVSTDGTVIASAIAPDAELLFPDLNISESEIFEIAQTMGAQGRSQRLFFIESAGGVQMEVINIIADADDAVLGYLISELNLNNIVFNNLQSGNTPLQSYSFLVLPGGNRFLALQDDIDANRISLDTEAVQAATNQQASDVLVYATGSGSNQRQVVGYYAPVEVQDSAFSLITEVDLTDINIANTAALTRILVPLLLINLVIIFIVGLWLSQRIIRPMRDLQTAMSDMNRGNLNTPVEAVNRIDEFGALATSFVDMRQQVSLLNRDMTARLDARNRDLSVTQDIARATTAERDLQKLMDNVIKLIVERFPTIYHAQIFLIDADNQYAVLRASTGEAGQQLLARGHRLEVGSVSVIGQVTEQGQQVLARDTAVSDVHRRNEFLSETRAELAIPLRFGDRIIGALDVQSREPDGFPQDLIDALRILAAQITIAIENARLFSETERLLSDVERERQLTTRRAWNAYLDRERMPSLKSHTGHDTQYDFNALRQAVYNAGQPIVGDVTSRRTVPFVVPIRLRGEVIGVVEYEVPQANFQYDKVLLAEEFVNRLAVSLDNARLFQESQQATQRERIVNEISAKLTGQTDLQEILRTAVREVQQALRTSQVAVNLRLKDEATASNGTAANNQDTPHTGNGSGADSTT